MNELISALTDLIGKTLELEGMPCQVIDVLNEGPSIVLHMHNVYEIQSNQYGEAQRRVPKIRTIPLLSDGNKTLHPLAIEALIVTKREFISCFKNSQVSARRG